MINRVLLTGATGFIGSQMLKALNATDVTIRVLVRNLDKIHLLPDYVEIVTGDLTDPYSLQRVCDGIETVYHLAGYAHTVKKTVGLIDPNHAINYLGTENLLQEALRAHVKQFIYFSSVKAVAESHELIDESWDKSPHSAYGIAKREAEKAVLAAGKKSGMHVCILRPALVYGPSWKGNLASMLRAIDKGYFIPLPKIDNKRSLVSVNDLCQAAILAATLEHANGKTYFVTDGHLYSSRQMYELMCHALGKSPAKWHVPLAVFNGLATIGNITGKLLRHPMPFDSVALEKLFGSACYNSQQIQNELNFKPDDHLAKLLPEIVAAYRAKL